MAVWPLAALAGVLGVWVQLQQASLNPVGIWAAAALGGVLGLAALRGWARVPVRRYRRQVLIVVSMIAAAALAFGWTGWRALAQEAQRLDPSLQGQDIRVTGQIEGLPQRGERGPRFVLLVESATPAGDARALVLPERLLLTWYPTEPVPAPDLRAGDRWRLTVRLRSPHGAANPHGFDRERWLWERGIGATGYVRTGARVEAPQPLPGGAWHPVAVARQAVAGRIADAVPDPRRAGVLAALVVGEQSAIDRNDWALFRATGVAHLMSISGLHVTVFAWLATLLIGALWRRLARWRPQVLLAVSAPVASGLGGLALAWGYAVFSGWGVPAQRTVLMLAIVVGLRLLGRQWPWPVTWLTVMVLVLLMDPMALMQPGFWLSFVAVAVLFATDPAGGRRAGPNDANTGGWRAAARRVGTLVREQAVMTVALAPLTLLLFGQFSVAGLLANLIAIPWVTLLVTPLALLGVGLPPLWSLAAWGVQILDLWLQWLAGWSWAVVYRPMVPWPLALAAVAGGVLLVLRWPPWLRLAGCLLLWPALTWAPARPAPGGFELLALDVGQGGAVLVRTASHSLLYDTGPRYSPGSDAGDLVILPTLRALGEQPERVVVSHGDSDHAGGAASLARAWPAAQWLSSAAPHPRCEAGQRWEWDGVVFEVLHPRAALYGDPAGGRSLSSNALSCVLLVSNGRQAALLAGDLDAAQETRLALARPSLRADVLLAPHHGSRSSSSPVLLNTLRPAWVLVQAGYRNRFGHPAPEVLDRYRARGIRWAATPECGAITWRSDHPDGVACERARAPRYWQYRAEPTDPAGATAVPEGDAG
ncbi:DNA internalization-related competence protein ComEC/Rec2 [Hydrogenophaga sp. NFH-34]|uniref:DNA internalization-related competence protein ComEC/Rec2 n=1 Tax=Hydrogenophaga sp. NFH-34 TaxID=2744446 RepID=UPI001F32A148|nr:DNA internalization-related competence protein ComEC/Rec2 [Hydrogenophaga sp. NFH-34]